jgi:hypothetical protein
MTGPSSVKPAVVVPAGGFESASGLRALSALCRAVRSTLPCTSPPPGRVTISIAVPPLSPPCSSAGKASMRGIRIDRIWALDGSGPPANPSMRMNGAGRRHVSEDTREFVGIVRQRLDLLA